MAHGVWKGLGTVHRFWYTYYRYYGPGFLFLQTRFFPGILGT